MKKILFLFYMLCVFNVVNAQFGYSIGSITSTTQMTIYDQQSQSTFELDYCNTVPEFPSDGEYDLGDEVHVWLDYRYGVVASYQANNAFNYMTPVSTVQRIPGYYYDYYLLKSRSGSKLLLEVYRSMSGTLISIMVYSHNVRIVGTI